MIMFFVVVLYTAIATFKCDEDYREENEGKYSYIFNQIIFWQNAQNVIYTLIDQMIYILYSKPMILYMYFYLYVLNSTTLLYWERQGVVSLMKVKKFYHNLFITADISFEE